MLHTLCYISSSSEEHSPEDLNIIFDETTRNNLDQNITGILIYNDHTFFQVLEGNEEIIKALYTKISHDTRHKHMITIIDAKLEERIFHDYETGFQIIDNPEKIKQLQDYFDWLKEAEIESVDTMIKMVENFIDRKL